MHADFFHVSRTFILAILRAGYWARYCPWRSCAISLTAPHRPFTPLPCLTNLTEYSSWVDR
jgi:hypothetical protein